MPIWRPSSIPRLLLSQSIVLGWLVVGISGKKLIDQHVARLKLANQNIALIDASQAIDTDVSCIAFPDIHVFYCARNGDDELEMWSQFSLERERELKWERPI